MLIPFGILLVIWVIHLFNLYNLDLHLFEYGIYPRKAEGVIGIFASPFLHDTDSWSHIINNSPPLFVLLWLLLTTFKNKAFKIVLFIWISSGIWTWIAARPSYHIGVSGVIYGLAFFLFFSGIFRKNTQLMGVSLLVTFLYGSMIWGLFPIDPKVSFEGHVFGALSGIIMAIYMKDKGPAKDTYNLEVEPDFEQLVDQYNQALFEEQYWQNQYQSNTTQQDEFKIFFDYIKEEENS